MRRAYRHEHEVKAGKTLVAQAPFARGTSSLEKAAAKGDALQAVAAAAAQQVRSRAGIARSEAGWQQGKGSPPFTEELRKSLASVSALDSGLPLPCHSLCRPVSSQQAWDVRDFTRGCIGGCRNP